MISKRFVGSHDFDLDTEMGLMWVDQQRDYRRQQQHQHHRHVVLFVSTLVLVGLFWLGFIQACWTESARLHAEVLFWRMKGPPVDCGVDSPRSEDIDAWSQWIVRALWADTRDRDCMHYIERVRQSAWPNLMLVMSTYISRVVMLIPLTDLFHLLSSLSYVMQSWLVIGVVLLAALYWFFRIPLGLLPRLNRKEERMAEL
jgi:hypothetical protein